MLVECERFVRGCRMLQRFVRPVCIRREGAMNLSIGELLILLVIVALLFGTKRLRNLGGDLGAAIKGFRTAMREGEKAGREVTGDEPKRLRADGGEPAAAVDRDSSETK